MLTVWNSDGFVLTNSYLKETCYELRNLNGGTVLGDNSQLLMLPVTEERVVAGASFVVYFPQLSIEIQSQGTVCKEAETVI